jgi:hypothetical protein
MQIKKVKCDDSDDKENDIKRYKASDSDTNSDSDSDTECADKAQAEKKKLLEEKFVV